MRVLIRYLLFLAMILNNNDFDSYRKETLFYGTLVLLLSGAVLASSFLSSMTDILYCLHDSYVERLLDCISNGKLAEDKRNAMAELQAIVAESHSAQLAFGTMGALLIGSMLWYCIFNKQCNSCFFSIAGFPVLFGVLKERDDVEMV